MKYFLLIAALFIFINANSQVKDSVNETALMVNAMNHLFGKVDGKELPAFTAKDLNGKTYTN